MLKNEVRILVAKEFTVGCLSTALTIYAIVRGVRGVEHLGLVSGSVEPEEILRRLGRSLQEVRIAVRYEDALKLASSRAREGLTEALGSSLNYIAVLLRKLEREIDRLLCRDNYLNSS